MPINVKEIQKIPEEAFQRRTRSSVCTDTIEAIKNSKSQRAEITGGTQEELDKFYKTLIQWRSRHKDEGVQFRKTRDSLYIWIGEAKEDPESQPAEAKESETKESAAKQKTK